jgi:hypothetical protein
MPGVSLPFCENLPPLKQMVRPKQGKKLMCLIQVYKVIICDLVKGSSSLVEVGWHYGKKESSIHSSVLNSIHPYHAWFSSMVVFLESYACDLL